MAYLLKYGSYTFPNTFRYRELSNNFASSVMKLPLHHGDSVVSRYKTGKRVSVDGYMIGNNIIGANQDFQTIIDALRVALASGPQNLQIDDARYLPLTQVLEYPESYDDNSALKYAQVRVVFHSPYAFWFDLVEDSSASNPIVTTPSTVVFTVGGNAPALPRLVLTAGNTGTLTVTVTNNTTGDSFVISGSVTMGDLITVDSFAGTVTIGGTDRMDIFRGSFFEFPPGGNSLEVVYSAGIVTNLAGYWRKRYQ